MDRDLILVLIDSPDHSTHFRALIYLRTLYLPNYPIISIISVNIEDRVLKMVPTPHNALTLHILVPLFLSVLHS